MFENEAEEYAEKHAFRIPYDGSDKFYDDKDYECSKEGFQKGAEFGYNKANEWHFVKDGDLPNTEFGRVDVTVAYINAYENPCKMDCCFDGTNFIYWDARKPVGWKKADIFGKIYAWKYPEKLPELPKEIE